MTRPGHLYVAEPGRDYQTAPPIVVDCSVLAALLFNEPNADQARAALSGHSLFAPWLIDYEMVSVALKKSAAGLVESTRRGMDFFTRLRLNRRAPDPHAQWELAVACALTAYDAAYLQLAVEMNAPLVTYDQLLGDAAQAVLGRR